MPYFLVSSCATCASLRARCLSCPLSRAPQILAGLEIAARSRRDSQALYTIAEHQRVAGGAVFLRGNQFLDGATFTSDVLRGARGFTVTSPTEAISTRDRACDTRPPDYRSLAMGGKPKPRVAIYIDGERFLGYGRSARRGGIAISYGT